MEETIFYVITFNSIHHAIKGEKILIDKGLNVRTIPTPREISTSCGLSIKFDEYNLNKIKTFFCSKEFDIEGVYRITKGINGKEATKLEI